MIYKHKPAAIEAIQLTSDNLEQVKDWLSVHYKDGGFVLTNKDDDGSIYQDVYHLTDDCMCNEQITVGDFLVKIPYDKDSFKDDMPTVMSKEDFMSEYFISDTEKAVKPAIKLLFEALTGRQYNFLMKHSDLQEDVIAKLSKQEASKLIGPIIAALPKSSYQSDIVDYDDFSDNADGGQH